MSRPKNGQADSRTIPLEGGPEINRWSNSFFRSIGEVHPESRADLALQFDRGHKSTLAHNE